MSKVYGPYSATKEAGGFVFVAGQVGVNPNTKQAPNDFNDQLHQVFQNLAQVLRDIDLDLKNVINVRVYLTDMLNFAQMNQIYETYFDEIAPSRECVEVTNLPPVAGDTPLLVEISAVAARDT